MTRHDREPDDLRPRPPMSARTTPARARRARSSPATTWAPKRCAARWTPSSPANCLIRGPRRRAGPATPTSPPAPAINPCWSSAPRTASFAPTARLPPPRLRAAHRRRQVQARDPLPLPRLDLRLHRRAPDGRARASPLRRARQVEAGPDARAGRDPGRFRVPSTSTPRRSRWPSSRGGSPSATRALPRSQKLEMFGAKGDGSGNPPTGRSWSRNCLEGYHVPIHTRG